MLPLTFLQTKLWNGNELDRMVEKPGKIKHPDGLFRDTETINEKQW